jgi:hypothetical protein
MELRYQFGCDQNYLYQRRQRHGIVQAQMGTPLKTIILTQEQWSMIYNRLRQEYAYQPSVFLIRNKMKQKLGFTVRNHYVWTDDPVFGKWQQSQIHLDFYDSKSQTFFIVKYLDV